MPYVPFRADPYISYNGLKLLLNLSFSPLVRKQIAELDGVKNVVAFLPNTRTRTAAIKVLYNLSTDGSCRDSFAASDCLTSVIKLCLMNKNPEVSFVVFCCVFCWLSFLLLVVKVLAVVVGVVVARRQLPYRLSLTSHQYVMCAWCFADGCHRACCCTDPRAAWKSLCELAAGPTECTQSVQQQSPRGAHEEVSRDSRHFPCQVRQSLVLVHVPGARGPRGRRRL